MTAESSWYLIVWQSAFVFVKSVMCRRHLLLVGGGAFWPIDQLLLLKKSHNILFSTLLQHGCLLTNPLANLKILRGRGAPPPRSPTGTPLREVLKRLLFISKYLHIKNSLGALLSTSKYYGPLGVIIFQPARLHHWVTLNFWRKSDCTLCGAT